MTPETLEILKRVAAMRDERRLAHDATIAASQATIEAFSRAKQAMRDAQEACAAAGAARNRSEAALGILVDVRNGQAIDETSACRTALEFAGEVAPELVDALTKQLAEREAAQGMEPAPGVDVAEVLAAVDRLVKAQAAAADASAELAEPAAGVGGSA